MRIDFNSQIKVHQVEGTQPQSKIKVQILIKRCKFGIQQYLEYDYLNPRKIIS